MISRVHALWAGDFNASAFRLYTLAFTFNHEQLT